MILAVASGKGGTGKTTVSVNLARVVGRDISLLDCDVEEPNVHLFIPGDISQKETVTIPVPYVDEAHCDGCGECGAFCQFHAIAVFGRKPLLFPEMCHGCGGCSKVCPRQAIREKKKRIGSIDTIQANDITIVQGRLDVGETVSPPLIRAVKHQRLNGRPVILDAPPGTSCPVIAAIRGADFVLLVTEPTAFGLHDLELAVSMVRALDISFGIVINRVGVGDGRVHEFCRREKIPILSEIPDDRRVAETYSRGELIVDALPEYSALFQRLWENILEMKQNKDS
jgi:MinD superfamily P-loop ATPase